MELDELKKSWNVVDTQLDKKALVDEQEMAKLISSGKANTQKQLGHLSLIQRISLCVGGGLLLLLIPAWIWAPDFMESQSHLTRKVIILLTFLAISLIAGLLWDWKTFQHLKSIRIDEMSIVEVSRRMNIFQRHMRYETIAAGIWIVLFNALYFWVMGYHQAPPSTQALVIALLLAADILIIYILYKKVMYKYINDIRKNIEELKDICTE
ncbi:hypothetical protein M3090_13055 [Bacteroides sp. ET71]|uniref:hypothetical protein n=1 Tax=Bacteroides sp. ET71 TaxID=2939421 RepID=UPI002011B196|nr:hypothetical protein [Bacteroides sp. ET71]MCL1617318.1 hypothetical protein [Bacteroides sp. ET71]